MALSRQSRAALALYNRWRRRSFAELIAAMSPPSTPLVAKYTPISRKCFEWACDTGAR